MSTDKKILITGAAGLVGSILRQHWGDAYPLRLADIRPVENLQAHEELVELDITQLDQFEAACQGIDTVIHLAADRSPRADFYKTLLDLNIIGAYNGFEAAARAGCRRLVFASSINAVLGYGDRKDTPWDAPVYPINVYGATKCWGEALGRVYSDQRGLSCIAVRLGSPRLDQSGDGNPDRPTHEISQRDTAQLFRRCIEVEDVDCAIVPGISRHRHGTQDVEDAVRILGYEPQDGTAFPRAPK
ncbi:MAG: NAD-dependent epimerase/dehydratase family protein [Candidatus Latescibacteria bacterium]|nr:NAD-dependent epimerase/dehydratase family protein [Candidatus Latescibacterota bacterium]